MSRVRRRLLPGLALASALGLTLAGCFLLPGGSSGASSGEEVGPTGEQVTAELEPYYAQILEWSSCGGGMECTEAIAPLDWAHPTASEDITLALTRHRATGEREGSLFINPGGPGASGYDFVHDSLDYAVSDDLQAAFDVIGWDPRGVGASTAVECYDGPQLDEFLFGLPEAEIGTPAYENEVRASAKDFAAACQEKSGDLLEFVDTESTVNDLDMLRAVVGDPKLNYFGFSYGSDIGAHYVDRFADRVGRVVLDGATDPTVSSFDVQLAQTEAFGDALRVYLADCLDQAECPFAGQSVDEALDSIAALLKLLDDNPLRGSDGRELTSAYLSTAITAALYDRESWSYLTDAFAEVKNGESATAFFLADYYVDRNEDGEYNSNFFEAFFAINCVDYPVETDPQVLAEQRDELAAADPLVEPGDLDALGDPVCQEWPYSFSGDVGPVEGAGAPPVLVVGTTGDPATPYQWAESLADQLSSGVLLTYVGEGHIAYDEGDLCINGAVDAYFIEGTVPSDGLTCES